ncbi:MAG: sulfur carrier protein ThiS [Rhodanobacteraceae bacterium]
MRILLNGEGHECETGTSVADLLVLAGLADRKVAVEINRVIVPRSQHTTRKLAADDRIEIVQALGGG